MDEARGRVAYRVLHRTVKTDPPAAIDFMSAKALGKPPRDEELADPEIWAGVSAFDTLESAMKRARRYPKQGGYIAEIVLPPDGTVRAKKTLSRGHYTLIGDPADILSYVARVFVVEPQKEGKS